MSGLLDDDNDATIPPTPKKCCKNCAWGAPQSMVAGDADFPFPLECHALPPQYIQRPIPSKIQTAHGEGYSVEFVRVPTLKQATDVCAFYTSPVEQP